MKTFRAIATKEIYWKGITYRPGDMVKDINPKERDYLMAGNVIGDLQEFETAMANPIDTEENRAIGGGRPGRPKGAGRR